MVVGHPVDRAFVPVRAGRDESMVLRWVRSECAFSVAYHGGKKADRYLCTIASRARGTYARSNEGIIDLSRAELPRALSIVVDTKSPYYPAG